ncbi:DUF1631 domain-containing protein [Aquimonas sp.]|jgi:hypothetical protein|uniref:DUF1631 domain-containing protein n=1 Tax=Aquimonas sp. TaxID=1872588 RepID=UPI0037C052A2
MNSKSTPDNIVDINGRLGMKHGVDISALVTGLRARAVKRLPAFLGEVLDKADNTLFDFVQRADGSLNHQEYFDAMRELRRQRPQIEQRFQNYFVDAFGAYERRLPVRIDLENSTKPAPGELSLVSEDELEEQLSARMVAVAISRGLGPALHQLNRRLSALIGGVEIDDENSPVGPSYIAQGFRKSLDGCEVSVRVKVLLFKLYERELQRLLPAFYVDMNKALIESGVLPEIRHTVARRPGAPSPRSASNESTGEEGDYPGYQPPPQREYGEPQSQVSPAAEQALFSTLHELLESYRGTRAGRAPGAAPGAKTPESAIGGMGETLPLRPLSPNEMLSVLSLYQNDLPESVSAAIDDPDQSLSQRLKQELLTGAERLGLDPNTSRMSAADEDAIDLVGMLFEVLLEERDFHTDTRRTISRLIVPFIKVAMLDRRMFLQKSHPARKLLNSLAEACEGNSGEAPQDRELLDRVRRTVDRLSVEFNEDVAIFETLEQEFREFIEQHRRRIALAERRAAEAQRGKERLEFARSAASAELGRRLEVHADLAPAIDSFLRRYWVHHITLMGLREGHDAPKYQAALSAGDALLGAWMEARERRQFSETSFSSLRPMLEPVLQSAGCVGNAADEVLQSLFAALSPRAASPEIQQQLAVSVERNAPPADSPTLAATVRSDDAEAEAEPDPLAGLEFEASDVERIRKMPVGTWVQFFDEDGNSQPAKLSWQSPISNRLLFVNRRGLRYCVASAEELAAMIGAKRLIIRQNDAAFEHAMNQVLGRLRANSAAGSGKGAQE